jgi:universal stress protein E
MNPISRILAVLDGTDQDAVLVSKAVSLAHQQSAALELFLCDSQCAYSLLHSYDQTDVEMFRRDRIRQSRQYLDGLRDIAVGADVPITVDAACESPLYEAIVRKVVRSRADLVIKSAGRSNSLRRFALDANDWQLMRACPATLLLSRGNSWQPCPRFVAAIDMSGSETSGLPGRILGVGDLLCHGSHGQLDVVYSDCADTAPAEHAGRVERLRALADSLDIPTVARIQILSGEPELALPAFAAGRGYDGVVLGALTHRNGLSALVGTLTSKLIDSLDCDFVLVKPNGFQTSVELDTISAEAPAEESEPEVFAQSPAAPGFVCPWQLPAR